MTQAEEIIKENFAECEDTPEDYGWSTYLGVGGLIFSDGSVIDVGEGADHRSILPEPQWNERGVVTYRVFSRELSIRIHRQITWAQFERIKELIELFNAGTIYYDYYDNNDQLKSSGAEDIYSFYNVVEEYIR